VLVPRTWKRRRDESLIKIRRRLADPTHPDPKDTVHQRNGAGLFLRNPFKVETRVQGDIPAVTDSQESREDAHGPKGRHECHEPARDTAQAESNPKCDSSAIVSREGAPNDFTNGRASVKQGHHKSDKSRGKAETRGDSRQHVRHSAIPQSIVEPTQRTKPEKPLLIAAPPDLSKCRFDPFFGGLVAGGMLRGGTGCCRA